MIVTKELAAIATTEGGRGATVMPSTVKPTIRRETTESQNFFVRDRLARETKR